jgi:hypothetical protein
MLRNLLVYGLLVVGLSAAVWLTGRLMRVPPARRPNGAILGNPWVDAEMAFDRALAEHRRRYYAAALVGRSARLNLPRIDETAPFVSLGQHPVGEQVVPLRDVIGTVDRAGQVFDRDFRPTGQRARDRFQRMFVAMSRGEPLPPVELFRWHGRYYVSDGHHRVAAARAMGLEYLAGEVTELVGQ